MITDKFKGYQLGYGCGFIFERAVEKLEKRVIEQNFEIEELKKQIAEKRGEKNELGRKKL